MGRKKKKRRTVIFCYYCDRHFDNEKVLIEHQRGKHFKCPICHRRLSSARGMMIHVFQVHKESIDTVPAAKVGRDSFDLEIFGMVGVPQDLIQEKQVKIYGEPQAKKQKIDHQHMGIHLPGVGGQQLFNPGMGMPVLMQQPVGAPMHMRPMPGGNFARFNPMQMPRGMMPLQQPHMMQRPGNPHMMNFNQQMQPPMRGMQPPRPMGLPNRPPPPHGHPGMGGHHGHQQQPPMGLNPNMQPPGGMMPPPPQQQLQQGMVMNPPPIQHQQPLSEAAKAEVVVRQSEMVTQASVQKKAAKKKIVRIYDNPGTCMEEIRAVASKYVVIPSNNTFVN